MFRLATPIERDLSVSAPFDAVGVFDFLRTHRVPGAEHTEQRAVDGTVEHRYVRALRAPHGPAVGELRHRDGGGLRVLLHAGDPADVDWLVERMRHVADADAPADEIDGDLAADPRVAPLIASVPGIRIPGSVDPPEVLLRAIVGQQISLAAAHLHLAELAVIGDPLPEPVEGVTRLFPTPAQFAERGADLLRAPESRRRTLRDAATALADGTVRIVRGDDSAEVQAALRGMRGIGPWTAQYVAMRALGDRDVMMGGDSALRLGLRRLLQTESVEPRELLAFAEPFAPWRSHLALHLWRVAVRPASSPAP